MSSTALVLVYVGSALCFILCARWRARVTGVAFEVRGAVAYAAAGYGVMAALKFGMSAQTAVLLACLAVSTESDLRSGLIFDVVTIPAFATIIALDAGAGQLVAGLAGAGSAGFVSGALHGVTGGRGLGLGDVKLFLVVGSALSVWPSIAVIGCAFIIGATIVLCALGLRKVRIGERVAFAPYIAVASLAVMWHGVSP